MRQGAFAKFTFPWIYPWFNRAYMKFCSLYFLPVFQTIVMISHSGITRFDDIWDNLPPPIVPLFKIFVYLNIIQIRNYHSCSKIDFYCVSGCFCQKLHNLLIFFYRKLRTMSSTKKFLNIYEWISDQFQMFKKLVF